MSDSYENIRRALAMGPTRGPRKWWEQEDFGYCCVNPRDGGLLIAKCDVRNPFDPEQRANAALISACNPDTIRELLEERDELLEALKRILPQYEALLRDCGLASEHTTDQARAAIAKATGEKMP